MEVHTHTHLASGETHTPLKKWTHYLWEFLMLFLAVFCGFLAENQREHFVEHQREKQYIKSLYGDLKADTAFFRRYQSWLLRMDKRLDTLIRMINTGEYVNNADNFYSLALNSRTIRYHEYHNSTYEQVKNSGNLRLLRSGGVADSLTQYNNIIHERVSKQEERFILATSNLAAGLWTVIDAGSFKGVWGRNGSEIPDSYIPDNPVIKTVDEYKMQQIKNLCFDKKLMIPALWAFTNELNRRARNMLLLIKEKYHLE
jgi:hypothetical protein